MFWYAHNWGKVLWTYRYNLFEHIGKESTVENHVEFSINPRCFDSNAHHFNFYGEKFDTQNCEHFMVSPCREPKIQKELELVGRENIESKPFLRMNERKMLMAKLNVTIIEEPGIHVMNLVSLNCFEDSTRRLHFLDNGIVYF
jgi:hypothetical protein